MDKQWITSGAIWEDKIGYARAVKIGNLIEVSGTTAVVDGQPYAPGNYYEQTKKIYEIIEAALAQAGATLSDIIRIRIFVCDISQWEAVGKAHSELFLKIKPAMSMIGINGLIDERLVVEIEATAIIPQHNDIH